MDVELPLPLEIPASLKEELGPYFASPRVEAGFRNPWQHAPVAELKDVLRWKLGPNVARPKGYRPLPLALPPEPLASFAELAPAPTRIFWIGHASFLLEMDGARVVIDPIFGRAAGLFPRVTPPSALPADLGEVRCVLVTHGHHDHLDPPSLKALAHENRGRVVFVVPHGLSADLPRACRPVVELGWWEQVTVEGLRIHLVPAQHWHRRGMRDTNRSLWGGFVIEGTHRVYHSGDTGYFGGFSAIGRVFGGIDAACLPLGAYEPAWFMAPQHMSPGESLAAQRDLLATHFVGMHWGAFDLSDEPLDAGPRFVHAVAEAQGLAVSCLHTLVPGGSVALEGPRGATRATARHVWAP